MHQRNDGCDCHASKIARRGRWEGRWVLQAPTIPLGHFDITLSVDTHLVEISVYPLVQIKDDVVSFVSGLGIGILVQSENTRRVIRR